MSNGKNLVTSATLIGRVKEGDEEAWNDLMKLYYGFLIYRVKREGIQDHDTAEEIAQQAMISIRKRIDSFSLRPDMVSWRPWIRKIARMKVYDYFRKTKREKELIENLKEDAELNAGIDEVDEAEEARENTVILETMVDVLHERTKISKRDLMIFYRCTCTDCKYDDVAAEYGIPVGTIATIKSRVLAKLKTNERYTVIAKAIEEAVRKKTDPT